MNPAFGLQLHQFIGAPESARLLYRSPTFWVDRLGEEQAMAVAVNLQRDAGIMLSNLQILSQFVTSLHRMSSEKMSIGMGRVAFPAEEIAELSPAPRATWTAKYMGLWVCGAHRRVWVIPGQCRPRPSMLAWTVGTVFRRVGSLRSSVYSSSANQSSYWNIMVWNMMQWRITEQFLSVGRMPWLCNIYIGLAIRDILSSFCVLDFVKSCV